MLISIYIIFVYYGEGIITMATNINKGIYPIAIYEFIKNNSDCEQHIHISDIVNHLKIYAGGIEESSIKRTVERHIDGIVQFDENIHIILKNDEENYIPAETPSKEIKEIYYDHPFSSNDIRILSDAVIFSKHLKKKDREKLLHNVSNLLPSHSNNWYDNAIHASNEQTKIESDLFRNLEYIDQAISEKRCIKFENMIYGINKKLHTAISLSGFSPYYIFIDNQTYYVFGVFISNRKYYAKNPNKKRIYTPVRFEIYKMKSVNFDDESMYISINKTKLNGKSLKDICNLQFDIHNRPEGIYRQMSENVKLEISTRAMNVIIPIFGNNLTIKKINPTDVNNEIKVSITPSEERYLATLKVVSRTDWNTILSLLNHYSISDIALVSHHKELQEIIKRISLNFQSHITFRRHSLSRKKSDE